MRKLSFTIVISGIAIFTACSSGNDLLEKMNDFDQGPMLQNIGSNLIVSAYEELSEESANLQTAIDYMVDEPSVESLDNVRSALKATRMAWQHCTPYQFGPAEANNLSGVLNIYPVDTKQIEKNITEGSYDLKTIANADARGFQALGYLLYEPGLSDEEIVAAITGSRAEYLQEISSEVAAVSAAVYTEWNAAGGNYLAEFTSEDAFGVNVGSSVGKLVNAMNRDFERNSRDGKVGIPVGIRTLGEPVYQAIEAYYAGYSVELLQANLKAYQLLYHGGDDIGLEEYLKAIQATTTDNADLSEKISGQFEAIMNAVDKLSDPLQNQIDTDKTAVELVFAEMHRLVVLFKTDMASSMGVVITYQDNDGD